MWKNIHVFIVGQLTSEYSSHESTIIFEGDGDIKTMKVCDEKEGKSKLDMLHRLGYKPICTVSHAGVVYIYDEYRSRTKDEILHLVLFDLGLDIISVCEG